jgi:hypothetical protein
MFNLVFVCFFQQAEILAFSLPIVAAFQAAGSSTSALTHVDFAATGK